MPVFDLGRDERELDFELESVGKIADCVNTMMRTK
jgi:hypothetical protein